MSWLALLVTVTSAFSPPSSPSCLAPLSGAETPADILAESRPSAEEAVLLDLADLDEEEEGEELRSRPPQQSQSPSIRRFKRPKKVPLIAVVG